MIDNVNTNVVTRISTIQKRVEKLERKSTLSSANVLDAIGEVTDEPTGFENRTDSTFAWSGGATPTFTIAPAVTAYAYWIKGIKYVISVSKSFVFGGGGTPIAEGIWIFYLDDSEVLNATQNFTSVLLSDNAICAMAYWDTTGTRWLQGTRGDERHGVVMDWATHYRLHLGQGAVYYSGLGLSNLATENSGNTSAPTSTRQNQFLIAGGVFADEDLDHTIADRGTSSPWSAATFPLFYRDGLNWRWIAASYAAIQGTAGQRINYNLISGASGSQVQVESNNDYVLAHLFATNDPTTPIIAIQGQAEYTTRSLAVEGASTELSTLYTVGLPVVEYIPIATIIYQTSDVAAWDAYLNIKLVSSSLTSENEYIDWRTSAPSSRGGSSVTDHNGLTGRSTFGAHPVTVIDFTNPMIMGLNMGSYDITTTGLVDGVDVSAHAARHAAIGADPVDHDALTNFVANEHIDHSTVSVTAGNGLTGGGAITTSVTLNVGAGTMITVNSDTIQITDGANYQFIGTGSGTSAGWVDISTLAGAGLISSAGVLAVGAGNGITVNADSVQISDGANYQFIGTGSGTSAGWVNLSTLAGNGLTFSLGVISLTTPGTLTVSTTNNSSGNHTHAITTSSNPGATVSILATDDNGYLTLVKLSTDTLADKSGGDLTVDVTGDIILDADGGSWIFKDAGTEIFRIINFSTDVVLKPIQVDKDIIIYEDGGTEVARFDSSAKSFWLPSTNPIQFRATSQTIYSSVVGQLDIDATTEIELSASTTLDIDIPTIDFVTQATTLSIKDDTATTFKITEGTNVYLAITTTNSAEALTLGYTAGTVVVQGTTITLDASGDIVLDADGADISFKDAGTEILRITNSSTDVVFMPVQANRDIIFKEDAGAEIARFDSSAESLLFATDNAIQFRATTQTIYSSGVGILDIDATTEVEITAPTVQVNSSTLFDVVGPAQITGNLTFVSSRTISTTTGDLIIAPAGDLQLNPTGVDIRVMASNTIKSDNYASQVTGWGISYAGSADFRYLFTDELHAKVFIADMEQALAGGQIISKSVAPLASTFKMPAAGAATNGTTYPHLLVETFMGFDTFKVFVDGDIVRLRQFSRSGTSLSIADAWGTVVWSSTDTVNHTQTYVFTRSAAPNAGAMATDTILPKGQLVLDYGTDGNGYYEVNAIDGAMAEYSPYSQIVTWATHPAQGANRTVRSRTGNLKGITSVTEYGLYAGDGTGVANKYLKLSNVANELHNVDFYMYDSANIAVAIKYSVPSFALGAAAPTGYASAEDGVWIGKDSATYKMRIGDSDGEKFQWDGSTIGIYANATNYLSLSGSTMSFYSNGNVTITLDGATGDAVFGRTGSGNLNLFWDASEGDLAFRRDTANRILVDGSADTILVGQQAALQSNVFITSGSLQLRNNAVVNAELTSAGELILGDDGTAQDWISISSANGIRIYGNNTLLGQWTPAGVVLVGQEAVSKSNIQITSGAVKLRTNTTDHIELTTAGTFWAGDTNATERIQWDTTNGLRIYDANNAVVFSSTPAGVTWLSTLAISDNLGQSLFSAADGLLLLGPGCAIAPTSWTSTRGQVATISGAFHQVVGRWTDTKALVVEIGTTNLLSNPSLETNTTSWAGSNASITRITSDAFMGSACGQGEITSASTSAYVYQEYAISGATTGRIFTASVYVKAASAADVGKTFALRIGEYGGVVGQTASGYASVTLSATWQRVTQTYTLVDNDRTAVRVMCYINRTDGTLGSRALIDAAQLEERSVVTSYCDGSLGSGYTWNGTGTPHANTSTRTATGALLDSYVGLINLKNTVTHALWVRAPYAATETWPDSSARILDCYGGTDRVLLLYDYATSDRFRVYLNGDYRFSVNSQTFAAGAWLHLVLTLDYTNDSYCLYLNGDLIGSDTTALTAPAALTDWVIGSSYTGAANQTGFAVSEYAVFGRVLTAEEIAGLYAAGRPLTDMGALKRPGIYILDGEFDIRSSQTGARVQIDVNGVAGYSATTTKTFSLETDGDLFLGSNISAVGTTALAVFANAQTYNSESMGAGDVLLGDNSAGKINLLWDVSEGDIILRRGNGAGAARITLDGSADSILIGQAAASQNNVLISSGAISIRNNTTERIGVTAAGILTIKDSAGNAVITLDASSGAEITKKLTMPGSSSAIAIGSTPPTAYNAGTGIWIDRTGLFALDAGTYQVKVDATDGKLYAGAGNIFLDSDGVSVALGTGRPNGVCWVDGIYVRGKVWTYAPSAVDSYINLGAFGEAGGSGYLMLTVSDNDFFQTETVTLSTSMLSSSVPLDVTGDVWCSGQISTDGGTTQWDLGAYSAGAPTADGYVSVVINGSTYKLLCDKV